MKITHIKVFLGLMLFLGIGFFSVNSVHALTSQEQLLLKEYIDNAPVLPKKTVKSNEDYKAISELFQNSSDIEGVSGLTPYLSAKSIEMFQRLPAFVADIDSSSVSLYNMKVTKGKITVLSGMQYAIVSITEKQKGTGYSTTDEMVMVKESGVWKIDMISSIKKQWDKILKENPKGLYVKGKGKTDLSIVAMNYEQDNPKVNSQDTKFLVELRNNGKTTIYSADIALEINGAEVIYDNVNYTLKPKKRLILELTIDKYWSLPGVTKSPGLYRTEVYVNVNPYDLDQNLEDNAYYDETTFR